MPRKGTTALAALFVFGTASVVLADTNNRTDYHGLVAQRLVLMTMSNGRTGAVNDAARAFTTEEKVFVRRTTENRGQNDGLDQIN